MVPVGEVVMAGAMEGTIELEATVDLEVEAMVDLEVEAMVDLEVEATEDTAKLEDHEEEVTAETVQVVMVGLREAMVDLEVEAMVDLEVEAMVDLEVEATEETVKLEAKVDRLEATGDMEAAMVDMEATMVDMEVANMEGATTVEANRQVHHLPEPVQEQAPASPERRKLHLESHLESLAALSELVDPFF